jgi:hypothetical protein
MLPGQQYSITSAIIVYVVQHLQQVNYVQNVYVIQSTPEATVKRIAATEARKILAEIIEDVHFNSQVIFLTHYGEDRAAVVPADSVDVSEIEGGKRKSVQSSQKKGPIHKT